jgi:hypothetical protein
LIRVVAWTTVTVLLLLAFVAIWEPFEITPRRASLLAGVAILLTAAGIVGGYSASLAGGMRQYVVELETEFTRDVLVQRRPGWPTVTIPTEEITSLQERNGWLIVQAEDRSITIPAAVNDFEELKAELARYKSIEPFRGALPVASLASLLLFVAALTVLFFAQRLWLVALSGGIVLFSHTATVVWWHRRLPRHMPKGRFVRVALFVSSALVVGIVYLRVSALL